MSPTVTRIASTSGLTSSTRILQNPLSTSPMLCAFIIRNPSFSSGMAITWLGSPVACGTVPENGRILVTYYFICSISLR